MLKLKEETDELVQAKTKQEITEEIADVLEVVEAIAAKNAIEQSDILNEKESKARKRGTFSEGYYLVSVEKAFTEEERESRMVQERLVEDMRKAKHKDTTITIEVQK